MDICIDVIKELIAEAYSDLKLFPINGQDRLIEQVLIEFFVNKKRNVILSAPTGTGKSIIGGVVARVFAKVFEEETDDVYPAMLVVHSNSLVKQYGQTFSKFKSEEFHQIIGAANYTCAAASALSVEKRPFTGEDCFKSVADNETQKRFCDTCAYARAKSYINNTKCLITNYSYHFISSMYSHHVKPRKIVIFDEAHNINDVFCEHNAIYLSVERIDRYIDELKKFFPGELKVQLDAFAEYKRFLEKQTISEGNYIEFIKLLVKTYTSISRYITNAANPNNLERYLKLKKMAKKYADFACKISDLISYQYEHVLEVKENEFSIKPVFVDTMSGIILSEYNLFMSATISDSYMLTTVGLKEQDTAFIKMPPVYEAENKTVVYCGAHRLNYTAMKNEEVIEDLREMVSEIVKDANKDNYKGLMLTPSFAVGELLSKKLPKGTKLFLHKPGEKVDSIISQFKKHKGAALLVSPSIYEGLDFADDDSRYQIIVKAPYPSLGEKRMKYIADRYPEIYRIMTLKKIVQGIGRSCRNKDDWCITFLLDANAQQLFDSRLNVWINEFNVLK